MIGFGEWAERRGMITSASIDRDGPGKRLEWLEGRSPGFSSDTARAAALSNRGPTRATLIRRGGDIGRGPARTT